MKKKCFKCGKDKPLSEFYKHSGMADGHLNKCKDCIREYVNNNQTDYDRTEKGVIRVMYKTQVRNRKVKKLSAPEYSKLELSEWLYKNNFKKLYEDWVASGYKKNLKPSVDRLDTNKGYSFDNIQLVTWGENFNFAVNDRINGIGTQGKCCKPVILFDKNNNEVCRFNSISKATRTFGYCVFSKIKNKTSNKDGSYWNYL